MLARRGSNPNVPINLSTHYECEGLQAKGAPSWSRHQALHFSVNSGNNRH